MYHAKLTKIPTISKSFFVRKYVFAFSRELFYFRDDNIFGMKKLSDMARLALVLAACALTACINRGGLDGGGLDGGEPKESVVRLDDGTIDDWEGVTYPDFMLYGSTGTDYGKFDYDANYIYFMFVLTEQDIFTLDKYIWNLRLDIDDNKDTGFFTKSLGCEWYYEGNSCCEDPINDWYIARDGDLVWADGVSIVTGVHGTLDDGRFFFEVGLSRQTLGIDTDRIAFFTQFYNEDWDEAVIFRNESNQTAIHLALNKE